MMNYYLFQQCGYLVVKDMFVKQLCFVEKIFGKATLEYGEVKFSEKYNLDSQQYGKQNSDHSVSGAMLV